jgi:hypothetical protein
MTATQPRRRGYPFHPVKVAGALLLGLGVFGGWLLGQAPALTAPVLNPLSTGLLAGATTLSGTGTPGSRVQVFDGTTPLGIATVGADGRWSLRADLPPGAVSLTARALQGDTPTLASNRVDLTLGALSATPQAVLDDVAIAEPRVDVNAFLPNAPFLLTGTAAAGQTLEVFEDADRIGETTAGTDGNWSFLVTPKATGDRDFSVRKTGAQSGPVVTLNIAEPGGTAAACPCRLRFILTNPAAQDAQITLSGSAVAPVTRTVFYQGKSVREIAYPALPAGSYGFTVAQSRFKPVRGNAAPPRNRAFTVYLDPQP